MKCSFCGFKFDDKKDATNCKGCPFSKNCDKICCPRCGFEMAKPIGIFDKLKRLKGVFTRG